MRSLVLTLLGLISLLLLGMKSAWGWVVGLVDEVVWIAYAVLTRQWAFIASALAYGVFYTRGLLLWRASLRQPVPTMEDR